jgi:methyl-accepting chemotaxis protein
VASNAIESGKVAVEGGDVVHQTSEDMMSISQVVAASAASVAELGNCSQQIGKVIGVINDIAHQINLLALNATIEAERAGEQGRGFAVVADEVRKLADRTAKATDEIARSIKAIQTETASAVQRMDEGKAQVTKGVERAKMASASLQKIVSSARQVADRVQSIAAVTREAGDGASQAASTATELSTKSEQLNSLVSRFKIRQSS